MRDSLQENITPDIFDGFLPTQNKSNSSLYIYYDAGPGRLGNWLFGYASASAIARQSKRTLLCKERSKPLKDLLPNLDLNIQEPSDWASWVRMEETHGLQFNEKFFNLPPVNVTIGRYFQSFKYFENISTDIFKAFSDFNPLLVQKVKAFIDNTKQELGTKLKFHNPTTVCVHIRRGDLLWQKYVDLGLRFAPLDDIKFAMKWMETKYNQVIFIIASEELYWKKLDLTLEERSILANLSLYLESFQETNVVMSNMTSDLEDFVLMQSCDHMIMTVGTFGWWAARMTSQRGGDVMYYRHPFRVESNMYQNFDRHSRFPGHWMSYGDNLIIESKDLVD